MKTLLAPEIIWNKREGLVLADAEIDFFINGMMDQSVTEGQVAALAMAIFFKGLNRQECTALTRSLRDSGTTLQWQNMHLNGPVVDKHSTGGVGDKVSIMLAPMLAACGAYVPMISGRGLGHTGGTLDKMECIEGYSTTPSNEQFQSIVAEVGCAIVGQTENLAAADKKLYGIRDVTATVESIPLITASILSKKLAAGLDALVMDIKSGSGAFIRDYALAQKLSANIIEIGTELGMPTSALITDMNQVLGRTAGHALEMHETVDYLNGDIKDPRLHQVVVDLGAELLTLCGLHKSLGSARAQLNRVLDTGAALEVFSRMVTALGGPSDFVERRDHYLGSAKVIKPAFPRPESVGQVVASIDVRQVGNAIITLGGGRTRPQDPVDHSVGLSQICGLGEVVSIDQPFALVHAANENDAELAIERLNQCYTTAPVDEINSLSDTVIYQRLDRQSLLTNHSKQTP